MLKFLSSMVRVRVASCPVHWRESSIDELVDVAQDFDLAISLHFVDVDDIAPPTLKLTDAEHHASSLSKLSCL